MLMFPFSWHHCETGCEKGCTVNTYTLSFYNDLLMETCMQAFIFKSNLLLLSLLLHWDSCHFTRCSIVTLALVSMMMAKLNPCL